MYSRNGRVNRNNYVFEDIKNLKKQRQKKENFELDFKSPFGALLIILVIIGAIVLGVGIYKYLNSTK